MRLAFVASTALLLIGILNSSLAYAVMPKFEVLPKNRELSLFLIERRFVNDLITPTYSDNNFGALKGEALATWYLANPNYRQFLVFNLAGVPVVGVLDIDPERRHVCYYYFNSVGEYLNSFCGGPERRWTWNN